MGTGSKMDITEAVIVFEGHGVTSKVSRVTLNRPLHIELGFLIDTREQWRQLYVLRNELAPASITSKRFDFPGVCPLPQQQ